eukprot:gene16452-22672_t
MNSSSIELRKTRNVVRRKSDVMAQSTKPRLFSSQVQRYDMSTCLRITSIILFAVAATTVYCLYGQRAPSKSGDVLDSNVCDRQCRYHVSESSFYDRTITGEKFFDFEFLAYRCRCFKDGESINGGNDWRAMVPISGVPYTSPKAWNSSNFWSGDFNSQLVCAQREGQPTAISLLRSDVDAKTDTTLHCGQCAACSNLHDMEVMYRTRDNITAAVTACSAAFAKPKILGGHHNLVQLVDCLITSGVDFTTEGRSWEQPDGKPTCMDCWTDNIMSTSTQCKLEPDCIKKFFDSSNDGNFSGCLKCDEKHSGPEFIRCAGANRRSTGIQSDITRQSNEICEIGYYSNRTRK